MRRFIFGFMLGLLLNAVFATHAQSPLATGTLTVKDVIEIAADFEILYPQVPQQITWYGVTDMENRTIFIIRNATLASRRQTTIHEFIHVARHFRGVQANSNEEEEQVVHHQAAELYRELFAQ